MTKHAFDPHDPKGKLQLISEEFVARPDHNEPPTSWRPGDSLLGDEAMKMSMEYYAWKVSRDAEQEREQHRIDLISYKELHRVRRWQRIKRGMATLALVVTGYGVAAPGGVIDRVASINTKTAEVATSVNVQQQYTPAKQRIVEAYSEIDAHGTDQLVKRAKDFRASHPDEFSSSSQIQKAHDRIGEVDTADELRASAEAFLTKYGVETVIISDSVSLDDTRDILHAITDVLGPLPTKFVLNQTVFNTLRIESSDDSNSDDGDRGGTMSSNGEMILYALPLSGQALQPVSAIFGQPMSYQHIVAHELIHAWQTKQGYDNSHYPSVDTTSNIIGEYALKNNIPHIIGGGYNLHLTLIGQVIIPHETACVNCFRKNLEEINKIDDKNIKKLNMPNRKIGSFPPLSALSASITSNEAFKILAKINSLNMINKRTEFLLENMNFKNLDMTKREDCEWCGKKGKYTKL